jgi:lipoprotein Spr/probable lipoprotein NlpC
VTPVATVAAATRDAQSASLASAPAAPPQAFALVPVAAAAAPSAAEAAAPARNLEAALRKEVASWRKTPYRENGTTRKGIGNPGFVRAVLKGALSIDIPSTVDQQMKTGKLVEENALEPGDLVFFDGKGGFGPFKPKPKVVGIVIGKNQVALAEKELGVVIVKLSDERWKESYKTARRMPTDPNAAAPTFDVASYGDNRKALIRDVAKAWVGTLYKQGGTTFDGIGNDEFVRSIYEAIYDTELDGTPKTWPKMGVAVKRTALEPGDIILYEAVGMGKFINQRHAGLYIGDGEFVHAVKGSAVTISKLKDKRWNDAFEMARRIDPDALERQEEEREARSAPATAGRSAGTRAEGEGAAGSAPAARPNTAPRASSRTPSETEARLRDAVEPWRGTPYKIGGTSKSGVDCSALVRALYEEVYGMKLPRTAEEQERLGKKVDRKSLETGDLVFFRTKGMGPLFKARHVGIYLGGGEFAQSSGRLGVNIARLDNRYWNKKYETARRLPAGTLVAN